MRTLSLYVEKWYIVGAINDDSGSHALSLSNREDRIWLYFYNNVAANRVEYGYEFKNKALAGELNYYTDIFQQILGSEGKTYKRFGRDVEMRTIFQNAGIFEDLKDGDKDEYIETYVSFSSDIRLEGQSIFLDLLRDNKFEVKEFVGRLEFLTLECALKKNIIKDSSYIFVANACNENLHYSLYRCENDYFKLLSTKSLKGLGEDMRSRALIEQVLEVINTSAHIISTEDEFYEEYLYLSRFTNEWIDLLDSSYGNVPVPLGWINLKKQLGNKYPVSVQKSVVDERTSVIIDSVVAEMTKLLKENNIQCYQISNILFIGDTFDNRQFKKSLSQHVSIQENEFVHFHEKDLAGVINIYTEIPSEWFDDEEKEFSTLSEAQRVEAETIKRKKQKLEEAREKDEQERLRRQQENEKAKNLKNALTFAQDAENKKQYNEALDFYKTAYAIDPSNTYISQKIEVLNEFISELKSKIKHYNEYLSKAREAYDKKDWDNVLTQSTLALDIMPDASEAKDLLKEAKDMAAKYLRLKEYLKQIDFLIEKKAYIEAQHEIRNTELLNVRDSDIEKRRVIVEEGIRKIEKRILELEKDLKSAILQEDYKSAVSLCSDLCNIDVDRKEYWDRKKMAILHQKEQRQIVLDKLSTLRGQIDEKHLAQDWNELQSLCKAYLIIKQDEYIKELLAKSEEQINIGLFQQQFDKAYEERDWQTILSLSKKYSILKRIPANNRVIKEAMAQNRKKTDNIQIDINDREEVMGRKKTYHPKGPRRSKPSSPISLLPVDNTTIELQTDSPKPYRKFVRRMNDKISTQDKKCAENTNISSKEDVAVILEQTMKKRKFPKVKRNNTN